MLRRRHETLNDTLLREAHPGEGTASGAPTPAVTPTPESESTADGGQQAVPAAGWYPDPSGTARLRFWDGAAWTEWDDEKWVALRPDLREGGQHGPEREPPEASDAGGTADAAPGSGEAEELLGGPRYRRAAVGAALATVLAVGSFATGGDDALFGVFAALYLAALPLAFMVAPALRFRLSVDPAGIHRRRFGGSQFIPWRDVNRAVLSERQETHIAGEGVSNVTPYWVLVVLTRDVKAVGLVSGRGWQSPRRDELEEWADAINRWNEIHGPRQRQGS